MSNHKPRPHHEQEKDHNKQNNFKPPKGLKGAIIIAALVAGFTPLPSICPLFPHALYVGAPLMVVKVDRVDFKNIP